MKTLYLLICLLVGILGSASGYAQNSYSFSYDESGNRTNRSIISLKSATIQSDSIEAKQVEKPLDDQIGLQKTRIYPNPTKGILRIDLPELTNQTAKILIHDSSGKLIFEKSASELNNTVNLSACPPGIYILSIQISQNNRKEWKIIKE